MGVWLGGGGGGCASGVYTAPAGGPGLGLRKKILKINIENLHFRGHIYAVFVYFLNIILHWIIPKRY
jgi:hypothetical protein